MATSKYYLLSLLLFARVIKKYYKWRTSGNVAWSPTCKIGQRTRPYCIVCYSNHCLNIDDHCFYQQKLFFVQPALSLMKVELVQSLRPRAKMPVLALLGAGMLAYSCFYLLATALFDCDVLMGFLEKFGKSPRRLKGKVVFITGASSGIGEHTAYALAKAGAKLVLTARRNAELQRVKLQCIALSNGQLQDKDVLVIPMDVLEVTSHKTHFQHAVRHFGTVDILVNNAGRSQRATWESIDLTVDRQMFELDVFAVVNLTRVALEHFNKRGEGHVVVVSSLAGRIGAPYSGTYTGAKHAIHGYFNSLRNEKVEQNIHVTLLCPGPVFSNFLAEAFTDKPGEKYQGSTQPTDRRMTAERCGHLNAVAIVNKVEEAWIGLFPVVPMTYISVYFPLIQKLAIKMLGPKKLFKFRDSKEVIVEEKEN